MVRINAYISLFLILVCGVSCISSFTSNKEKIRMSDQEEMIINNQAAARILDKYENSYWELVLSSPRVIYPSYFGGMYIDDMNNPIILTTDMSKENLIKQFSESDKVVVKQCTYSYWDLLDIEERVMSALEKEPELWDAIAISNFGIYESKNCLEVAIVQSTPEKINLFKSRVVDSPMLTFRSDSAYISVDSRE